ALVQHLRVMWKLYTADAVPSAPNDAAMDHFEQNFGTAEEIDTFLATLVYKHKDAKKQIRAFRNDPATIRSKSTITRNIVRMNDNHLDLIYSVIIQLEIVEWNPDVLGSPDSMYNIAHERVAIISFQTVAGAHGYAHLGPNLTDLADTSLLAKSYRNFVFSYILKLGRSEANDPGSVARARSSKVTNWIHMSDIARLDGMSAEGQAAQVNSERLRIMDPNDTTGSNISQRLPPPGVPLDWFDPVYFNALPANLRAKYARKVCIALPLERHLDQKDWKNMSEKRFMKKYGNDVLALYNLPTAEELEQI
ncbi:hypothetical protein C8J57DRAFT_1025431, partial [Mycena rebaudengoi]